MTFRPDRNVRELSMGYEIPRPMPIDAASMTTENLLQVLRKSIPAARSKKSHSVIQTAHETDFGRALMELAARVMKYQLPAKDKLTSPTAAREYLKVKMRHLEYEVFVAIWLDNQHQVIDCEEIFRGSIDGCVVYPREVVKRALANNAAAVIFAHNHPSGVADPSPADVTITRKLKEALGTVDIRVLDHIVIGRNEEIASLAEQGKI